MKYYLLAIGNRMPSWVNAGVQEYQKRLPKEMPLIVREIPAVKRDKNAVISQCIEKESRLLCEGIGERAHVVLLDVNGEIWSTEELAASIKQWQLLRNDIYFLIGGADGVDQQCREKAHQSWSLSRLTLPHPLVRIIVAEQLYRAMAVLQNHPYHRS